MKNLWRRLVRANRGLLWETYGPTRTERWPEPRQVVFMVTIEPGADRAPSLVTEAEVERALESAFGSHTHRGLKAFVAAELIARG